MIRPSIEPELYKFLKDKIIQTPAAYFHAIGGIEEHIHLVVSVKPSVHLDEWIGQLKGASSYELGKMLQWQIGYGIVSFGTNDLKWVVNYVLNQREHHSRGTIHDRLERIDVDEEFDF